MARWRGVSWWVTTPVARFNAKHKPDESRDERSHATCVRERQCSNGEHRLGPVQGLHGRFLVDADHHRMIGRIHVKPDDISDLVHEQRAGRQFGNGVDLPGFETERLSRSDWTRRPVLIPAKTARPLVRTNEQASSSFSVNGLTINTASTCSSRTVCGAPERYLIGQALQGSLGHEPGPSTYRPCAREQPNSAATCLEFVLPAAHDPARSSTATPNPAGSTAGALQRVRASRSSSSRVPGTAPGRPVRAKRTSNVA